MRIIKKCLYHKTLIIIISVFLLNCNTKKDSTTIVQPKNKTGMDSLRLIKDTIVYGESAEGESIKFLINKNNNDSIIIGEAFGETGKAEYKFIFNRKLISGTRNIILYDQPINSNTTVN